MAEYFVYILTNEENKDLYVGVTDNLVKRVNQHREKLIGGFAKEHNCTKLVWYEVANSMEDAGGIQEHMQKWKRETMGSIIQAQNPTWIDLSILFTEDQP